MSQESLLTPTTSGAMKRPISLFVQLRKDPLNNLMPAKTSSTQTCLGYNHLRWLKTLRDTAERGCSLCTLISSKIDRPSKNCVPADDCKLQLEIRGESYNLAENSNSTSSLEDDNQEGMSSSGEWNDWVWMKLLRVQQEGQSKNLRHRQKHHLKLCPIKFQTRQSIS